MKKLVLAGAALLLAAFGFAGCGNRDNEIIMYTNSEFPPFEYLNDAGDVVGVDVDIMNEVAKAMGKKLVIKDVEFGTIVESVKSAKGDVVGAAGITEDEDRRSQVDFSKSYFTAIQYILCRNEDIDKYTDLVSMSGKKIGVQLGTTGDQIVTGAAEGSKYYTKVMDVEPDIQRMKGAPLAAEYLKQGKLDLVVIDKLPAQAIAEKNSGLTAKLLVDPQVGDEAYGIIVTKGNTALLEKINDVLDKLIADKKIEEFVNNHFGNK